MRHSAIAVLPDAMVWRIQTSLLGQWIASSPRITRAPHTAQDEEVPVSTQPSSILGLNQRLTHVACTRRLINTPKEARLSLISRIRASSQPWSATCVLGGWAGPWLQKEPRTAEEMSQGHARGTDWVQKEKRATTSSHTIAGGDLRCRLVATAISSCVTSR